MAHVYMLDTCICSFIMREHPVQVLNKLQDTARHNRIVISAVTYAEMRYGAVSKKASPKINEWVNQFIQRVDAILSWDAAAVEQSARIKQQLERLGTPIGNNDLAIAGHAIASSSILVTNNTREFERVDNLVWEDWVQI